MSAELKDGELICPVCKGTGESNDGIYVCKKCLGTKKVDWISIATELPIKPTSVLDKINIKRMVLYIRDVIDSVMKKFVFETYDNAKIEIESFLDSIVKKKGIYNYNVVCDASNNYKMDVYIKPINSVEVVHITYKVVT